MMPKKSHAKCHIYISSICCAFYSNLSNASHRTGPAVSRGEIINNKRNREINNFLHFQWMYYERLLLLWLHGVSVNQINIAQWKFMLLFHNFRKLKSQPEEILPIFVKGAVLQSLNQVFGEIGGQTEFDLLTFDESRQKGVIRVPTKFAVKTRAALTFISEFQGIPASFQVNHTANSLPIIANEFAEI